MLSGVEIKEEMAKGGIRIDPYNDEFVNTNSYDVCMGNWIFRQRKDGPSVVVYNSRLGATLLWQSTPAFYGRKDLILLEPGETILCHTDEVIGGRLNVTTEMRAKSTTARYGLSVCKCAGLGDVGYVSRWTMEMTNHTWHHILVPVGEPIAQILFHCVSQVTEDYGKLGGRYGQGEWSPYDMLPKGKRP